MARDHATIHNQTWDYGFGVPALDIEGDFRTQVPGTFSRLVGIDGRYKGRLRRFPGWAKNWTIPTNISGVGAGWSFGGSNGIHLFESYAIQLGPGTGQLVRGIIYLVNLTIADYLVTTFSVNGGAEQTATIASFYPPGAGNGLLRSIDIAVDHQLLHIVGETDGPPPTKLEKVARYCGSGVGWQAVDWDTTPPRITTAPSAGGSSGNSNRFITDNSNLGLSYRFVYPDQGYVGPLCVPAPVNAGSAGSGLATFLYLEITAPNNGNIFTRCVVQVFRTIDNQHGNEALNGAMGNLYLESEQEVPRRTGSLQSNSTTFTTTTVTSAYLVANAAVGDVIYLRPRGANFNRSAHLLVFRRQITAINGGTNVVTWNAPINIENCTTLDFCISRAGAEADTSGQFTFGFTVGGASPIRWGWNPGRTGETPAPLSPVPDCPIGLRNESLVLQPQLDPEEFGVFPNGNPRARMIELYDDIYVRVTPNSSAEVAQEMDVIRWDRVDRPRKGLVPVLNRRRVHDLQAEVVDLVNAGPFLAVILNKGLMRIHRSGERLAIDPIHNRFGSIGSRGTVAVSSLLYLVSSTGILLADLNSGQIDVFGVTQHFFDESSRWGDDLDSIEGAFDAAIGAVVFLNPVKAEMLCIWLNHGVLAHYVDVPFNHVLTSSDLVNGGVDRAVFLLSPAGAATGGMYTIDARRAAAYRTSAGNASGSSLAWNGLANTGTNATTLVPPAGKAFSDDMVGHYVRFFDPTTGAFKVRVRVTNRTAGNLVYATASPAPAPGDRFAVGAIPFQATAWPLSGSPDQPVLDLFKLKKTTAMGAAIAEMSGDTDPTENPNLKLRYQMFGRGSSTTPLKEVEGTMSDDLNSSTFAALAEVAVVLVPGMEQWSSNLDFDALGMIVQGPIEGSRRD